MKIQKVDKISNQNDRWHFTGGEAEGSASADVSYCNWASLLILICKIHVKYANINEKKWDHTSDRNKYIAHPTQIVFYR